MTKQERKEYMKAWREAHKDYQKAWYEAHKQDQKAYYQAHKEQVKTKKKAWYATHKQDKKAWYEAHKEQVKAWRVANKERLINYMKCDLNSLGKTKNSIRCKSCKILKQMNLKLPDYEIHHCFGYEDANKFIYISKSLHLKIHQYLRDHNISADSNHWMQIRDIVNAADEFTYIRC